MQKYLNYYLELEKSKYLIEKYFNPGQESDNFYTIRELYTYYSEEKKEKSQIDPIDVLKMENLRKILKGKTKEQLLNCISDANIINKLSYIERLKMNTIPVMKFREYPETYEKLKEILGEEAKYYKISENDIMKDFTKTFNDISPDIKLKDSIRTFTPVFFVKIKDSYHQIELPEEVNEENKSTKQE